MNNADGTTPAPRKPAGREGGQRAGLGATEPIRSLLCPSPCQPVLQVNYFPVQNSSHIARGLRYRSQAVWGMMRKGPLKFLENSLVAPGLLY